ncbi:hypothetical protein NC652_038815 [Populus alba x Populus x berolinensis]|nr:hypothetical protein NC652_038815 [Populus alba x Populus x berolinensis]
MRAAILALSFLLFAFAAGLVPKVAATAAPEPVLDVTGKILRTGTSYYILPVVRGRGGGLKMASTGRRTCPLAVVQERYEASNGLPLKLTPVNTKKGVVRVHTDLNIRFSAASICHQSTAWKLDNYDEWTKQWFVTTNGVEGNPGPETTNNWFKIEKFEDKYKLVFCPTVCQHCKVMCKDIGIFVDAKGVRPAGLVPKVAATAAPEPVLDVTGKILRTGTSYYILPVVRGRGGGLKMASTGRRTCPLAVVQERYEASNGLPLKLTPVNTKKGVVRVHTDLNIRFSAASICHQSTAWKLDNYDEWTKQWFVTTNGVEGNPGPETTNNWFKIEKFEDKYKLVFCPTVCQHCKVMCKDIGIFVDAKGVRRLALSSVPLKLCSRRLEDHDR